MVAVVGRKRRRGLTPVSRRLATAEMAPILDVSSVTVSMPAFVSGLSLLLDRLLVSALCHHREIGYLFRFRNSSLERLQDVATFL